MLERNKYITCYKKCRPSVGGGGSAGGGLARRGTGGQVVGSREVFAHLLCQGLNRKCVEGAREREREGGKSGRGGGRGGVQTA